MGDEPSFLAEVEAAFIAARGQGLMLAEADIALVDSWEAAGIPSATVCRAIFSAVSDWRERHGSHRAPPHRLKHYEDYVNQAAIERRDGLLHARTMSASAAETTLLSDVGESDAARVVTKIEQREAAVSDPRLQRAWRQVKERLMTDGLYMPESVLCEVVIEWACDYLSTELTPDETTQIHNAVTARLASERIQLGSDGITIRRRVILHDEIALLFNLENLGYD